MSFVFVKLVTWISPATASPVKSAAMAIGNVKRIALRDIAHFGYAPQSGFPRVFPPNRAHYFQNGPLPPLAPGLRPRAQ